jgi:hypothetical protein
MGRRCVGGSGRRVEEDGERTVVVKKCVRIGGRFVGECER